MYAVFYCTVSHILLTVRNQAQMACSVSAIESRPEPEDDVILLTSSGPSAEYQGSALGLYRREGTHNNSPYYKHLDIEEYIYRNKNGEWYMGISLGYRAGYGLWNENKTDSVPLVGWKCWNGDASFADKAHWWLPDPHLKILTPSDPSYPLLCGEITIEAPGNSILRKEKCLGVYKLWGNMFSAGRRVFKHSSKNRFLMVKYGFPQWCVDKSINFDNKTVLMSSSCAPSMCPADPRAMKSQRFDKTSWRYYDDEDVFRPGAIYVTCSVHKWEEGREVSGPGLLCHQLGDEDIPRRTNNTCSFM